MTSQPSVRRRGTVRSRALGVVGAALAALVVWLVAVPLLGVELRVAAPTGTQAVGAVAVVTFALGAALLGWALLVVLERFTHRAVTIWTTVALVLLLASLVPPFFSATTTAGGVVLALMHLAVAAVLVPAVRR